MSKKRSVKSFAELPKLLSHTEEQSKTSKTQISLPNTVNLGWYFFKDYYIGKDGCDVFELADEAYNNEPDPNKKKKAREECFDTHFNGAKDENGKPIGKGKNGEIKRYHLNKALSSLLRIDNVRSLKFTTTYPGLTTGIGMVHETGSLGEYKLGFYFDHTTGLPAIPGSSVKGVLRSIFPRSYMPEVDQNERKVYIANVIGLGDAKGSINEILLNEMKTKFLKDKCKLVDDYEKFDFFDLLEKEIFEGKIPDADKEGRVRMDRKGNAQFKSISIYDRDVFFDAHIVEGTQENLIVDSDFITPHKNSKGKRHLDPFSNPIPLMFLKILPGVTFSFQFDLKSRLISKDKKKDLFRQILLTLGIGAKTNVGYGQFK